MRKILLFIPALLLALATNAAVININTGTADALRIALGSAPDGAEIVMAAGTYVESPSNYIAFSGKSVIVRAADGAEVILKPHVPITLSGGARAEIRGIKIDASELCSVNSYSHLIYPSDGADNNRLILDGCEIYGYTEGKAVIASRSSNKLDSLIINNCKFFNHTTRSCVFLENTENKGLKVANSTFYNIATGSESFGAGIIDDRSTTAEVRVDHCTFYNVVAQNTDYAAIGKIKTSDAIVSNCIFAMPTSTADLRAIRDVAQANNCLTYNYTKDSNWGIHSDVTKNNCIQLKDPLFADAASGDFSLAGNWVTMSISPARCAGTDGSHLGDPRWHSTETLPSTDFAPSYIFLGTKALLSGSFALNGDNYIQSQDKTYAGIATWKIEAERKCIVEVTLNIAAANTSGHRYEVALYDANNSLVGTALAEPSNSWSAGDKVMGTFEIPAAGNYTVKLTNDCANSSTIIEGVTFAYVGGAVQSMPCTTNINDAWFSSGGTRGDSKIDFPDGSIQDGWVKWNVSFANAANYNVTVNIDNANGHNYTVALYRSESDASPITLSEGGQKSTIGTIELGSMEVPAGDYIMKVTNATQYSDAKLVSVNFSYAGGAAVNLSKAAPASLLANADAILSDDWTIEDGKITHAESKALTGWAKWNVDCADFGNYNVTVNISSDNGHLVRVEIFEDEAAAPIYTLNETSATQYHTGDQAIDLGNIILDEHEYVVKVSNTGAYSHVQIASIVITYQNGARTTLPATLNPSDAMLSSLAYVESNELYFAPSDKLGHIHEQWAKWNVKVASAGTFLFTMNVSSTNGQKYKISVLDSESNIVAEYENNPGTGVKAIKYHLYLAAGNYSVEARNTYQWSDGHMVSLVVTEPSLLVLDEAAASNSVLVANANKAAQPIQLIRTIVKDMYNTICLPFDVNSTQLQQVFGSDVVLKQLESSSLDASGEILDLNFESASSIYRGTPYIIKTSRNIVNPVFEDAVIKTTVGDATSKDDVDFVGNLVAGTITASENNLFIGANNILYFPTTDIEILGMRAYFQVKSGVRALVKGARIVEHENSATGIENVGQQPKANSQKLIENGQIVIIRDGIRYNIMGVRMQ